VPFVAIALVLAIGPALFALDRQVEWQIGGLSVTGARSLYETVITLTLSFLVFTFGSLLVALQVASAQMTPRIIATTLLRNNVVRYSVGLFTFSLMFAVMALDRLEATRHEIVTGVVASLGVACLATFLFLIDHAARLLRPITILARVGDGGLAVIDSVYPRHAGDQSCEAPFATALPEPRRTVPHAGTSAIVLAIDRSHLVREARNHDGVIEVVPQVGEFVASGEPLLMLYGGATRIADRAVRAAVAFGPERTMEQDPLFSFRIIVDIALKALSPAINDPTTAVLAIDQLHRLLRTVGRRQLRGYTTVDELGQPRLLHRGPNWEAFVQMACTEIRRHGAGNVQIARRLLAMLDDLATSLPRSRYDALELESRALRTMVESLYVIPADLTLALDLRTGDHATADLRHHNSVRGQPWARKIATVRSINSGDRARRLRRVIPSRFRQRPSWWNGSTSTRSTVPGRALKRAIVFNVVSQSGGLQKHSDGCFNA
jgi:uncharacterized membrane protein